MADPDDRQQGLTQHDAQTLARSVEALATEFWQFAGVPVESGQMEVVRDVARRISRESATGVPERYTEEDAELLETVSRGLLKHAAELLERIGRGLLEQAAETLAEPRTAESL